MCLETELISTKGFHYLPGRFRVLIPAVKGDGAKARFLAAELNKLNHVAGYINPVTGRLLMVYDVERLNPASILESIAQTVVKLNKKFHPFRQISPNGKAAAVRKKAVPDTIPWNLLAPQRVLQLTGTSPKEGLTPAEAARRLAVYGPNQLVQRSGKSVLEMLLGSFQGFMSKLLLGAAAVSFVVGGTTDALVITTIVILQAGLETLQEYRAEKSLEALKELSAPAAEVIRGGEILKLPAAEIVPGDLIRLAAGDRIPADARMLESSHLLTDESCLTGESIPVRKNAAVQKDAELLTADKLNMVFAGTNITRGKALAVVTATGMETEMGKIAALLAESSREKTILHRQMEFLGQKTTNLVLFSVGAIIAVGMLRRRPLGELLSTGVSLAVGAIPEGLPAVVTVALAFGVQRMAKRNAIVRRLSAVETLGSVTAICADKTGTLTANEMTVKQIFTGGEFFAVTGEGYNPTGSFYQGGKKVAPHQNAALSQTLLSGALCNNARLKERERGFWEVAGDPTEGALLTLAAKGGLQPHFLSSSFERAAEKAFDSNRKMMSVICRDRKNRLVVHSKGAVESVLPKCRAMLLADGGTAPLDAAKRKVILNAAQKMAGSALRVLALAGGNWRGLGNLEEDLIFTGLVGMFDPPRRGAAAAVQRCKEAGIKVIMITGDHQNTAEAVAQKLGLLTQGRVCSGRALQKISERELLKMIEDVAVFARTTPEQKLRIVRALQKRGHIVAMTGDGINDAPAVKEANIGIAMGHSGTDVTREAAGITLSDDNFTTIVAGVEEGRSVAANIGKATRYILPGNWGQVLAVFLASVSGYATPLVPSQILWINLVTEGFPALALAADPPNPHCMKKGPIRMQQVLFPKKASGYMAYKALLSGLTTYGLYAGGLSLFGWSKAKAQSMAFAHVVMSRTLSIFDMRGRKTGKAKNPYILPAAGLSTAMLLLTLYLPFLNPIFKTVPLQPRDWGMLGISAGVLSRLDRWFR